ncbi:MAG: ribulose-phosphate 3-epimerase [Gemmatimonadales bacterium]|nr:MAG: ribulose-phosphate 3-epimerase [Gemmatimonadales bacterium]
MSRIRIAPSILSADFGRLTEEVNRAEEGGADWIHVDVMDGHFVPNITIGPAVTRAVRDATSLPVDVHLMIEGPDRYIEAFADAGADWISVHHEVCPHLHRVLDQIRQAGTRCGVALNPSTPVEAVREIVHELDLLVIMTVNPGFGGQRFIAHSLDKVRRARELIAGFGTERPDGSDCLIEVDGGVDRTTAPGVVEAGAEVLVAGSAVYGHEAGVSAAIRELRAAAEGGP